MASNVGLHIYSKEGHLHHGTVNNAVKHWRQQKFYISYLEVVHIYRSDGKCSVRWGIYRPLEGWWLWWGWWKGVYVLVWDITLRPDTLVPSYIHLLPLAMREARTVVAEMEHKLL